MRYIWHTKQRGNKMNLKEYSVEVTGPNGFGAVTTDVLEIFAPNADEAKKRARQQVRNSGWTPRDGKLTYRAIRTK